METDNAIDAIFTAWGALEIAQEALAESLLPGDLDGEVLHQVRQANERYLLALQKLVRLMTE